MQRTEKYYEADAFRREATGRILAVEPGKTGGKLALDGTVFYPEGGGQPADRGTLTLPDGTVLQVTDVHEQRASSGTRWMPCPLRRARRSRCRLHRLGMAVR